MKKLKIWNGRGHGKYQNCHYYVAAYSVKEASELIGKASGYSRPVGESEIRIYYAKGCWGDSMKGITPTEPCVYVSITYNDKPIRII
jgi:hypothetical protein